MNRSVLIALIAVIATVVWMMSGMVASGNNTESVQETEENSLFTVEFEHRSAMATPIVLIVQGQTQADREIQLRAATESTVDKVLATEGAFVKQGEMLVALDMQTRAAQLEQQKALFKSAQKDYQRLQALAQKRYQSESEMERRFADMKSAEAMIAQIQLDMAHTQIRAPFDGYVQRVNAEQGDLLRLGDAVAVLVDTDPLITTIQVAQQDIASVSVGQVAAVSMATGDEVEGQVRFIAPQADPQSRTFLVEIALPNSNGMLRAGVSATVQLTTKNVSTHYISPSAFSLDEDGRIGVKVVDDGDRVQFVPVEIVQADDNGAHVTGLPDRIKLITQGHGFVSSGTPVYPVEKQG